MCLGTFRLLRTYDTAVAGRRCGEMTGMPRKAEGERKIDTLEARSQGTAGLGVSGGLARGAAAVSRVSAAKRLFRGWTGWREPDRASLRTFCSHARRSWQGRMLILLLVQILNEHGILNDL